ncbi:type II toxin-antitoxin system death-on-curing family toxin [Gracilimonas sp.]|uniref:type II toxin-antitoxin system death-on-curing family toxin n=1 Tax=Gracilimonas sp. TaxID=1974203 RepID=UPI002871962B|nr:type II toxin-antitoxin system death-on-curing family toxin [Gracilimonas sp.]
MIKFLDKKTILLFHEDQIKTYGGKLGVRDHDLLESALAQPQASFGGEYVHDSIYKMAAAYGFHICSNHPFFDGNKRTALVAIYTFLFVNGYRLKADKKKLYAVIMDLANGKLSKDELSKFLDRNTKKM